MHTKPNQNYRLYRPMPDGQILEKASEIIATKFVISDMFTEVKATKDYLTFKLASYET